MREARERISRDIEGMTLEEEQEYIRIHSAWADKPTKRNSIAEFITKLIPVSPNKAKPFWLF